MTDCDRNLPERKKHARYLLGHHIRSLFAKSAGYLPAVHEVLDGFSLCFQLRVEQSHTSIFTKNYRLRFNFNFLQNIQIKQLSLFKRNGSLRERNASFYISF